MHKKTQFIVGNDRRVISQSKVCAFLCIFVFAELPLFYR